MMILGPYRYTLVGITLNFVWVVFFFEGHRSVRLNFLYSISIKYSHFCKMLIEKGQDFLLPSAPSGICSMVLLFHCF